MTKHTGTITRLVVSKGYGFIAVPGGDDVFFHASTLDGLDFNDELQERRVSVETMNTERGPKAVRVTAAAE